MKFHDVMLERAIGVVGFENREKRLGKVLLAGWDEHHQQYYKLYPALTNAFLKVPFDGTLDSFPKFSEDVIAIRFAEGQSPQLETPAGVVELASLVLGVSSLKDGRHLLLMYSDVKLPNDHRACFIQDFLWGEDLTRLLAPDWTDKRLEQFDAKALHNWQVRTSILAALFVLLLKDDQSVVQPEVLGRDEPNYDRANEAQRQVMVDRARRRGKVGWSIGKEYETCPHYRRPHFAIRWTGAGRSTARLTPIKGSVVHREVMTRVPTGRYVDGREVDTESSKVNP